ncbi:UNVERIFIED_CONTAM: hypothetical protein Scaly_1163600 [Sesamum calycinum]|uniref:Retrotransposon gag domain-containing protein n=1 Tax=Sesamum calycinum TaxID=2727403 RepID=A0AAW2Q2T2_9LAMI
MCLNVVQPIARWNYFQPRAVDPAFFALLFHEQESPENGRILFTIPQKENEPLRDYMQKFMEAVHEVSYVNHELLASIIQQNLLPGRFKESIADKPPSTMKDLLIWSQKYIRIEECFRPFS